MPMQLINVQVKAPEHPKPPLQIFCVAKIILTSDISSLIKINSCFEINDF